MKTYELFIDLNEREYIADAIKSKDINEAAKKFKAIYQLSQSLEKITELIKLNQNQNEAT
jgi:hypothetical protein